jgi:hypothetical protein
MQVECSSASSDRRRVHLIALTPGAHSAVVKFVEFGGGAMLKCLGQRYTTRGRLELRLLQQHDVLWNTGY